MFLISNDNLGQPSQAMSRPAGVTWQPRGGTDHERQSFCGDHGCGACGPSGREPSNGPGGVRDSDQDCERGPPENGCSESSKGFKIVIPNADKLDLNYKGVVAGVERVYTEGNGTRSDGDYAFADNGTALTFRLWVKGGGTRISGFGRNVCQGASGANTAVDFYGHYKR